MLDATGNRRHALHAAADRPAISWAKNNLITAEQLQPRARASAGHIVARVYPAYQARLLAIERRRLRRPAAARRHAVARTAPRSAPQLDARYRYILVDEYQDTNLAQYSIVRALSIDHPNLAVTGDPDQSIYGWRGANLSNILEFEQDYPDVPVVKLEQNYRSTKRILRRGRRADRPQPAAQTEGAVHRQRRRAARCGSCAHATQQRRGRSDRRPRIADEIRAGRRRPRDFAIFYRVNALSRSLEFALRDQGIPYQMVNGLEFYQRRKSRTSWPICMLINNPRDDVAFLRVINTPPRGIGKPRSTRLFEHAARSRLSLLDAARESGLIEALQQTGGRGRGPSSFAMIDRLSSLAGGAGRRDFGTRAGRDRAIGQLLADSEDEEDQERLANIEELLTAARQFDERHAGDGPLEAFLEEACLVERHRRLASRRRPRDADDAACFERSGISRRVHRGPGGGADPARAQPRRQRTFWRKSAGCCSSA